METWYNVIIVTVLMIMAGTYAGLTLAMFSMKTAMLHRKKKLGDKNAKKVYPLRKKGNLLLCALLLGNVTSYTIMAIFLGSITGGVTASFLATALIFIFGEILPQAVFPRFALSVSSGLSWLMWASIAIYYPVAAPIAWMLDKFLGEEPLVLLSKKELGEIIKYHEDMGDGIIDKDEERIILGALTFSEVQVRDIMIPGADVYTLDAEDSVNSRLLEEVKSKGYSKIPVYREKPNHITGILYCKDLVGLSGKENKSVNDLCVKENLIMIRESLRLDQLLNLLIAKKIHLAVAVDKRDKFTGIVTFEDIMEEVLKTELEEVKK